MSNNLLVSIIIPLYNRALLLPYTLESIIGQTYENWECIIVDDGSTDTSICVVENFKKKDVRFYLYERPENLPKGGNSCRNFGFEKSSGDFIQWFDSDDLLLPGALEEKLNAFERETQIVYSGFKTFSGQPSNILSTYNCLPTDNVFLDYLLGGVVLNIPSFMYRRSFVRTLRFSERLTRAQDLDFVFRCISQKDAKIKQIQKAHSLVRLHEQTITSRFSKSKMIDLNSEIIVREYIFNTALKFEKPYILYPAQKYINTLKKLIVAGKFELFREKLNQNENIKNGLKRRLLLIAIIYKLTNRGLTTFNKILNREYQ
ncbi:MAG: glycosyltransferase family 2 protein [Patiriisocius sp.]|uniref:glycosyltransferase family 2 protein n=1 Tax=Patiriisocius sp. TaxID=2822396 RepID=UPI003EF6E995